MRASQLIGSNVCEEHHLEMPVAEKNGDQLVDICLSKPKAISCELTNATITN